MLDWSKSELDYERKLVDSAVERVRRGECEFLKDESLGCYLERSAHRSLHRLLNRRVLQPNWPLPTQCNYGEVKGRWPNTRPSYVIVLTTC